MADPRITQWFHAQDKVKKLIFTTVNNDVTIRIVLDDSTQRNSNKL